MPKGYGQGDPQLAAYVEKAFAPEDAVLAEVRQRSAAAGLPEIQVGPLDGLLLELLARAAGARRAVEIGTLGGYSGICLLRGMGKGGLLHTFEISEDHAAVARTSFEKAGLAAQVKLHVGPALERLPAIAAEGPFDLCFIDADKTSYPAYLAWAADNLRLGGLVLGDNAFAHGHLAEAPEGEQAELISAMRSFAASLAGNGRFRGTIVPTGEGLALGVKVR
ncbi:MAG: O-methyltransferase [Myxococcales bacterium]